MAKSMARIENGIVVNIELHPDSTAETEVLKNVGDSNLAIGDAYDSGSTYALRSGYRLMAIDEEALTEEIDGSTAVKLANIYVNGVAARPEILSMVTKGLVGATVGLQITGDEWEGLSRTVVFKGCVVRNVLDAGPVVTVPAEVIAKAEGRLMIGVYGADSARNIVIPTVWCDLGPIRDAATPSDDPSTEPQLPVWAQLQQHIGNLDDLHTEAKGSLVEAINEVLAGIADTPALPAWEGGSY